MSAVQQLDTDILILGAGGAGLFAALHAKKAAPELGHHCGQRAPG